jgi:hypothetical protein
VPIVKTMRTFAREHVRRDMGDILEKRQWVVMI